MSEVWCLNNTVWVDEETRSTKMLSHVFISGLQHFTTSDEVIMEIILLTNIISSLKVLYQSGSISVVVAISGYKTYKTVVWQKL